MFKIHEIDWSNLRNKQSAAKSAYRKNPQSCLELTSEECEEICVRSAAFWKRQLVEASSSGLVIGLSGGIDSAVVASLACRALGSKQVFGVLLPSEYTEEQHIQDALTLAQQLSLEINDYHKVQREFNKVISKIASLGETSPKAELQQLKIANLHARLRMLILRDLAKARNFLVAGTGNASELFTGYFTLAGDGLGGIDNEVLGSLFKTQVRQLATYLKIPKTIIDKAPTAGLYAGQTDEAELGLAYEQLDLILVGWLLRFSPEDLAKILHFKLGLIEQVFERVARNAYKLQTPPVLKFHE